MSNDLAIMDGGNFQLPAHLQGRNLGVTENLQKGIFLGGNRIGLKGSRFRLVVNGKEEGVFEENYLDVIVLGASDAVGRQYYNTAYQAGENSPPACYSADGIVPADDVKHKQNDKCATCPQNVVGSKIADGKKFKACGYFRRLVVMLPGDDRLYKLDVKAQGLFGESSTDKKKMSLNDYIKFIVNRGLDLGTVVTRLSFDTNASVPKLLFAASRFVSAPELNAVETALQGEEVNTLRQISMTTLDTSEEEPTGGDEGTPESAPAVAQEAPQQPAQRPRPAPQQQTPTQQRPVAQKPAQEATQVQDDVPMPTQQRPVAQKPAAQKPVQQAPAQTASVRTVMSDADLDAMLDDLDT